MPRPRLRAPYLLRRRWTLADARAALSALAASGLSVGTFARREGLDEERLYRWRRRLAGESTAQSLATAPAPTPPLIELRPSPGQPEPIEVMLKSGVTLRVAETIDPSALA